MKAEIDFSLVGDMEDFYNQLEEKLDLPDYFGRNLDALYDVISGDLELPLELDFYNMELNQLEEFEDLIETLEDLEEELDEFEFSYSIIIQDEDDE